MKKFTEWLEVRENIQQESLINAIGTGLEAGFQTGKKVYDTLKGAYYAGKEMLKSPERKAKEREEFEKKVAQFKSTPRSPYVDDMKARMDALRNRAQGNVNN